MAKTATFALRLDEDLKNEAQKVFEGIGLPMSLAVELFLRQVVAKGKLPFALGDDDQDERKSAEQEERERDFWKSFILWYFKVWPHFDSDEMSQRAKDEFGFDEFNEKAGSRAFDYVIGDTGGYPDRMSEEQRAATSDLYQVDVLLNEAKELIYWALDMERTFVPSLSARYSAESDYWQYQYLREQKRRMVTGDSPVADGVIGIRYFGVDECGDESDSI